MVSGAVPIYWGCDNIGEFFNKRGMLCCSNPQEILELLPTLNEEKYRKMLPYVESNLEKSLEYVDFWARVEEKIKNTFNI